MIQGLLLYSGQGSSRRALWRAAPAVLIIAVAWVANFLHFTAFGFYEDDWYYFALPYEYTFLSWFGLLRQELVHFHLGRPLQDISQRVFGYVGVVLSSIAALYLFAFVLFSLSALLLYRVLRMRFPVSFSTLATLIFVLSPLCTIKQFLNYAFTVGPGFIFLFLAILLWNSRRKLVSLVAAVAALLTYQSLFFIFLAAPLFGRGKLTKARRVELLRHVAVCGSLVFAYALVRWYFAGARVAAISPDPPTILQLTATYCALFTIQSFKCYVYAAWVGLREVDWESAFYYALFFVPALLLASRLWPAATGSFAAARRKRWLWTAAAGLLLTALGYCLAYFHLLHDSIFPLSGRATRVSGAASVGSSILVAALLALTGEFRGRFWSISSRALTAACLSVLFLYSFVVQRDYVSEWTDQREFLTQAMLLSPDVRGDSQFIVRTNWIDEPLFPRGVRRPSIGYSRHGLQVSMQTLFGWNTGPRIFFVYTDDWRRYLALGHDQKLYWTRPNFPGGWDRSTSDPLTPGRIILMTEDSRGVLTRSETPVWVGGTQIVQLPQAPTGATPESNWPFLPTSALLEKVAPDYVLSAAMSHLAQAPTLPPVRIAGGLSLDAVFPAGSGGTLEKGPPLRIVTAPNSGYFAAAIPIRTPPGLFGARYAFLRARVVNGRIGIGVVDAQTRMLMQRTVDPSPAAADMFLPLIDSGRVRNLVFYNAADNGVRSEILIDDAALVTSADR